MRPKFRTKNDDQRPPARSGCSSAQLSPSNQPIKSPSPDKKSANIIACTRSPEMLEYKQLRTCEREHMVSSWHSYQQHHHEKSFPMSTPSKFVQNYVHKVEETQPSSKGEYRFIESQPKQFSPISNSRSRNTKIEIIAESTPEDFDARQHLSRIRDMNGSDSMEFDYIKLLKSKEQTIKELKQIIEMIKRNNTSYEEVDDHEQIRSYKERVVQLSGQIRQLKIENQHLLNVIEKNKKSGSPLKDQILQREIRQLKITIKEKDQQLAEASTVFDRQVKIYKDDIARLENENNALLRLLKDKEEALGNSSLSIQSKSSDKEKLTLIKIKQQHHQNLKIMKKNFQQKLQELSEAYHYQLQDLSSKLDQYYGKIHHLEMLVQSFQGRSPHYRQKQDDREEYHKEKVRHQQIESLMLEKYSRYQAEVGELKRTNDRLIQQLIKANKTIEELNQRLFNHFQEPRINVQEQPNAQIVNLIEDKNALQARIVELNSQNIDLRKQLECLSNQKDCAAREYQRKIELIMLEYENHAREEKNSFDVTISRLQQQLEQTDVKSKEIVDYYEKDKMDTEQKIKQAINIYNQQNQALKMKITQLNSQLHQLSTQNQHLKQKQMAESVSENELQKITKECDQLRIRSQNLEAEVGSLTAELIQMDNFLNDKNALIEVLEAKIHAITEEKEALSKKHSEAEIKNNDLTIRSSRKQLEFIQLQNKVQELEKLLQNNEERFSFRIGSLQKDTSTLEQKNGSLGSRIAQLNQELSLKNSLISRLQSDLKNQISMQMLQNEPIEDDLKELKRIVCEFFLKSSHTAEKEIVQEFYKLNYNFQAKLEQNLKLAKDSQQLKSEMLDLQRQRQILAEKVCLLEQNNSIYERELKQRRLLYDQLLQEKSRIEKQILLSKKIKVEQNHIQSNHRGNINQITSRIDRLLDIQRQRNQNMRGLLVVRQDSPERQ